MLTKFCQCGQVNVQIITRVKTQTVSWMGCGGDSLVKLAYKMGEGSCWVDWVAIYYQAIRFRAKIKVLGVQRLPCTQVDITSWREAGNKRLLAICFIKMDAVIGVSPTGLWILVHKPTVSVSWSAISSFSSILKLEPSAVGCVSKTRGKRRLEPEINLCPKLLPLTCKTTTVGNWTYNLMANFLSKLGWIRPHQD